MQNKYLYQSVCLSVCLSVCHLSFHIFAGQAGTDATDNICGCSFYKLFENNDELSLLIDYPTIPYHTNTFFHNCVCLVLLNKIFLVRNNNNNSTMCCCFETCQIYTLIVRPFVYTIAEARILTRSWFWIELQFLRIQLVKKDISSRSAIQYTSTQCK